MPVAGEFGPLVKQLKTQPSQGPTITTSVSAQSLVLTSLLWVLPVVEAVEAGDAIALFVGVVPCITGIWACLGLYSRKRNGEV
ncbi:small integral membrane protein 30-like [Desmodus rotundus]|uniref:small integral membrane protein 30-like n=1 Tax=Desmodus rotundus TaxID=9430 RepID=UPI0023815242|nr:small integral membrane protein 30-like [Desmodus rotundus]